MKTASVTDTKNQLSAMLERVKQGEELLILDRGRPVARLVPAVGADDDQDQGRLSRLERSGVLRRAEKPASAKVLAGTLPAGRKGASALAALLEERTHGR